MTGDELQGPGHAKEAYPSSSRAQHKTQGRSLPPEAFATALAGLPGMGPATLAAILTLCSPEEAWERLLGGWSGPGESDVLPGRAEEARQLWIGAARATDVGDLWKRAVAAGIRVTWVGGEDYPGVLLEDPRPPGVLFWRGSLEGLSRPRVAIVGTRNATPAGRAMAFRLGQDLALAGVCVISGLALGIDGSAHRGVLDALGHCDAAAGPLGVAASGVDVVYPRQHADLWEQVASSGGIVSETPPGGPARSWRFPSRNRIIAALAQLVVVVESHARGGSLITAEAALERGIEVRAVPGPVDSPASEGTNQLLYDGAGPVRGARDVLDALGLFRLTPAGATRREGGQSGIFDLLDQRSFLDHLSAAEVAVLGALSGPARTLGQVVARSGLGVGDAGAVLERLEARGLVCRHGSWWARSPSRRR